MAVDMKPEPSETIKPGAETSLEQLLRIAAGRELLEKMFPAESDPVRYETIYNAWAEAMCNT